MDDDRPSSRSLRLLLICLIGAVAIGCISIAEETWSDPQDPTAAAWSTAQRLPAVRFLDIQPDISLPALTAMVALVLPSIPACSAAPSEHPRPASASGPSRLARAPPTG